MVEAVCADSQDPIWVVNMKRGVLSAFQNTMDSLTDNHKGSEVRGQILVVQYTVEVVYVCICSTNRVIRLEPDV